MKDAQFKVNHPMTSNVEGEFTKVTGTLAISRNPD